MQNSVQEGTFNFWPILDNFHENTLNMTSYHMIELINSYFRTEIKKSIHEPMQVANMVKELKVEVGFQ